MAGQNGQNGQDGRDGLNGQDAPWPLWLLIGCSILAAAIIIYASRNYIRRFLQSPNYKGTAEIDAHKPAYNRVKHSELSANGDRLDVEIVPDQIAINEAWAHSDMISNLANARTATRVAELESCRPVVVVVNDAEIISSASGGSRMPTIVSRRRPMVGPRSAPPAAPAAITTTAPAATAGAGHTPAAAAATGGGTTTTT
jgi:hypothetical protein